MIFKAYILENGVSYTFTAFSKLAGDAFLISNSDNLYLVDGGKKRDFLVNRLNGQCINSINVVICTHTDADHINGIYGLMRSHIHVGEYWLPESFAAIALRIEEEGGGIENIEKLFKQKNKDHFISKYEERYGVGSEIIYNSGEEIRHDLRIETLQTVSSKIYKCLSAILGCGIEFHTCRKDCRNFDYCKTPSQHVLGANLVKKSGYDSDMLQYMASLADIYDALSKLKPKIRFIRYVGKKVDSGMGNDFVCLNGIDDGYISLRKTESIADIVHLTKCNKESLVYKYVPDVEQRAGILFCADSDFSFLKGNEINLPDIGIATAPHHGSPSNDAVYGLVKGTFIWVKSSIANSTGKPSPVKFYKQTSRYCTRCNSSTAHEQDVVFVYQGGNWTTKAGPCGC